MALKPCDECKTEISADANPCPKCGKKNPHLRSALSSQELPTGQVVGLLGMAMVMFGFFAYCGDHDHPRPATAKAEHNAPAHSEQAPSLQCALRLPDGATEAPVFPSKSGMDEAVSAAVRHDDTAYRAALLYNGAFIVATGTKCSWLDRGIASTQIRVLDGSHAGKTGWVPSEWVR